MKLVDARAMTYMQVCEFPIRLLLVAVIVEALYAQKSKIFPLYERVVFQTLSPFFPITPSMAIEKALKKRLSHPTTTTTKVPTYRE